MNDPLQRASVTLLIHGDDLVPEELSAILGVQPETGVRKGETFMSRGRPGTAVTARTGMWHFGTGYREPPHIHQQIASVFREAGLTLNNVQEATTEQAMIGLAAAGLGVSLVCASLSGLRRTEVVYRRLIEPSVEVEFNLVWRRGPISPVVQSFLQVAQEQVFSGFIPAYA